MFTLGVFAVILDSQRRVLLGHRRDYDLWNLPGGRLEPGEAPWEGVVREVKEEAGLEVRVARLVGVYSKPEADELVFSFLCTVVGGTLTPSDEADRLEFFALESLPGNTVPKQVERIRDALQAPDRVSLVVQRGPSAVDLLREGKLCQGVPGDSPKGQ